MLASLTSMQLESNLSRFGNPPRLSQLGNRSSGRYPSTSAVPLVLYCLRHRSMNDLRFIQAIGDFAVLHPKPPPGSVLGGYEGQPLGWEGNTPITSPHRFPPPWTVEQTPEGSKVFARLRGAW